jgi:hypothetical protein
MKVKKFKHSSIIFGYLLEQEKPGDFSKKKKEKKRV